MSNGFRNRRRFNTRRKVCYYCSENIKSIDYKQMDVMRRFVSDRGKIRPRRQTNMCAKHQRMVTVAVKRARHMALLPFVTEQGSEI